MNTLLDPTASAGGAPAPAIASATAGTPTLQSLSDDATKLVATVTAALQAVKDHAALAGKVNGLNPAWITVAKGGLITALQNFSLHLGALDAKIKAKQAADEKAGALVQEAEQAEAGQ